MNVDALQVKKLVVLSNVKRVTVEGMERLVIELKNGKKLIVEPWYVDAIAMCRNERLFYFDCIESNLRLKIVEG